MFAGATGGRSLRHTAMVVYGNGAQDNVMMDDVPADQKAVKKAVRSCFAGDPSVLSEVAVSNRHLHITLDLTVVVDRLVVNRRGTHLCRCWGQTTMITIVTTIVMMSPGELWVAKKLLRMSRTRIEKLVEVGRSS